MLADRVRLEPEQIHFIWSNFYRSLPRCTQVNYAQKCRLKQNADGLTVWCETDEVKRFVEDRWKSTLDRMFITDVMFMTEEEEMPF